MNTKVITGVLLCCLGIGTAQFSPEETSFFENPTKLENTFVLVTSDIDSDGDNDIVIGGGVGVSWLENMGNCVFLERLIIDYTFDVVAIKVTDIDGDGDKDIIANSSEGRVRWYENNGNQIFSVRTIDRNLIDMGYVDVVDLDNDGDSDILAAAEYRRNIFWYRNNGPGDFTKITLSEGISNFYYCGAGDFNNDGHQDVIAFERQGELRLFKNDGMENFTPSVVATLNSFVVSPQIVDLDRDRNLDFVYVEENSRTIKLLKNDGTGSFLLETIGVADSLLGMAVVDYDDDGDSDLLVTQINQSGGVSASILVNTGRGQFVLAELIQNIAGTIPLAADFSGDGKKDIVIGARATSVRYDRERIAELFVTIGTNFSDPVVLVDNESSFLGGQSRFADIDSDDDVDMLIMKNGRLYTLKNNGYAVFQKTVMDLGYSSRAITSGDYNGDGHIDLFLTSFEDAMFLGGDGSGAFDSLRIFQRISSIQTGDVNNDGIDELLGFETGGEIFPANGAINWYSYDNGVLTTSQVADSQQLGALRSVDWDGDGDTDVVKINGGEVVLHKNDGAHNFTRELLLSANDQFDDYRFADLDQDSDMDLVMVGDRGIFDDQFIWFENMGSDTLRTNVIASTLGSKPRGLRIVDVDQDQDMDVVFIRTEFGILRNDGQQNFTREILSNGSIPNYRIVVNWNMVDLDGDNDVDISAVRIKPDEIVWRENETIRNTGTYVRNAPGETEKPNTDPSSRLFYLQANYPNPFNPTTTIRYGLPNTQRVTLAVYDLQGQLVRMLVNDTQQAFEYQAVWDGRNDSGEAVSSGVYVYRLTAGEFSESRKMVLLR